MLPKKKNHAEFRRQLLVWFQSQQRKLPWRRTKDPYRIWISEIMLQQTRVAAVIPYYERFLARFPDVRALAAAPEEEVLRMWSGLGYYSRARNLHRAAREIVARHAGIFPRNYDDVLALSGIGRYTASAILSIAYGERHAVLDGNVARVLARLGAIRGDLREPRRWNDLQESADRLLAPKRPGDWNEAMMELGATLCTPRAPMCLLCPVSPFCRARALGIAESIPEKRRKRTPVKLRLAAAVFLDGRGRTLLLSPPKPEKNENGGEELSPLFSRMWQFPAIRVQQNAREELRGHLKNVFGAAVITSAQLEPLKIVRHAVTYREITLTGFRIRQKRLPRLAGARSVALSDFGHLPISNLTRKIAKAASQDP